MAGLTSTGYTTKRLNDIITSLKSKADVEFSSFLTSGDVLDTSNNSVLGRWIQIVASPLTELWETSQEVYNAFSITTATGVALEQLCAIGGVTRNTATATQALLVNTGTYGVTIPTGSYVRSDQNRVFEFQESVLLDENDAVAVYITPTTVANSTVYSFTYKVLGVNSTPVTVSYTSGVSATASSIVTGLANEINTSHAAYISGLIDGNNLWVQEVNQDYNCDFASLGQFTISKAKKATLASCTETGVITQDENTITTIQTPLVGWESVTNPFAGIVGTVLEADAELRHRFLRAKFQDGSNTYEAIYAAVLVLDGVRQVVIYENETDTGFVSPPVPAHSFYPIVLGGTDAEIAQAIWNNKPAGILSYGSTTVAVADSAGVLHDISFDRPTNKEIYINMTLVKDDTFPANGNQLISDALVEYVSGFGIGESVLYSRLYTPINSATSGFYVSSLTIGDTPTPTGTTNIVVDFNEIANLSASNISISFV